jgi:hypothetical protein
MRLEHWRVYQRGDGTFLYRHQEGDATFMVAAQLRTGWGLATLPQFERWQPPRLRVTPDGRVFDREGTPHGFGITALAATWLTLTR